MENDRIMTEADAIFIATAPPEVLNLPPSAPYRSGWRAFVLGGVSRSCPFPAPFDPPRDDADAEAPIDGPGAFWLDGWQEAQARWAQGTGYAAPPTGYMVRVASAYALALMQAPVRFTATSLRRDRKTTLAADQRRPRRLTSLLDIVGPHLPPIVGGQQ